jgi:hypothetical protein
VACFPLREKWVDIGTQADYRRAAADFTAEAGADG